MTKPVIVKRETKGSPLTYTELDTNFQNLADATITVNGDSGTVVNNLNDAFTISGGTGLTSSIAGTTVTVNLDNTTATPGSYTNANITVDAQGRITAVSSGTGASGNVNSGTAKALAYYPSTGTTIDDTSVLYTTDTAYSMLYSDTKDLYIRQYLSSGTSGDPAAQYSSYVNMTASGVGIGPNMGTGEISTQVSTGTPNITSSSTASYANNATQNFSYFQGLIAITRNDGTAMSLWLLAGNGSSGTATKVSETGSGTGTIAWVDNITGFQWTNNTGSTVQVNFFSVKTGSW